MVMARSRSSRRREDFTVVCHSHPIFTTVTCTPAVVRCWLHRIRRHHTHRLRKSRLVVGVGVQWKPSTRPGHQNRPATLQLCVGHHCLIFQLGHAPRVPAALRRFLSDRSVTFVGVSNKRDNKLLLQSEHGLWVPGLVDAADVARRYGRRGSGRASMEALAEEELGMAGVRKDPVVGRSDWEAYWLSEEQVEYASVDAFVAFMLGKNFKVWNNPAVDAPAAAASVFAAHYAPASADDDDDDDDYGDDDDDDDGSDSYY